MSKKIKRTIITTVIIICIIASGCGGIIIVRNTQKKPVNVYAVSDFSTMNIYGENSQTSGMVTTDKIQKVILSDTQTVKDVYVQEGQNVKEGDPLLAYDTTLSDLELQKARTALNKLEVQKKQAENELTKIKNMRPYSRTLVTPSAPEIVYEPQATPKLLQGKGTKEDPFYYLWGEGDSLREELLNQMFPVLQSGAGTDENGRRTEQNESYVVLIIRENNALNGQIVNKWGLHLVRSAEDGKISTQLFVPEIPEELQNYESAPEPYYEETGSEYTAEELAKMRTEKEQEIKDLDVSIRIAAVELSRQEKEASDGVVRSTVTGTVKAVRDPDEAYGNSEPVLEVSAGGGYYIDVAMSELELGKVRIGQTVQVNSYMTGTFCEGTVVEISEYPTTNANSWSDGNPAVSYYPFKVFVDESASLQENEYVDISYQSSGEEGGGFYLENQFIRTENGRSFVYLRNKDGRLEQRTVQTGRDLYGAYTEIRGGISMDDYVAFPYGKDVEDGAKTNESTMDEFYSDSGRKGGVGNV